MPIYIDNTMINGGSSTDVDLSKVFLKTEEYVDQEINNFEKKYSEISETDVDLLFD